jgi:phosphonatase-like hydrolase
MLPDLVVTDFAGTTMRDDGTVLAAYRTALTAFDIPFSESDLATRRGASKLTVFRDLASRAYRADEVEQIAQQALGRFGEALRQEYETGDIKEIDGARNALSSLKRAQIRLALTTGFNRDLLDLLVVRLGWGDLFDVTLASDDVPVGRPAPFLIYRAMIATGVADVRHVAVVGDTPLDLQSGMNAQARWVIGVLSGAHGVETLGATPHTHIVSSIADLPILLGSG